jgi:prephenate dehydrogenase
VALTSHLPQVLSTALAAFLSEQRAAGGEQELLRFVGGGLKTFLRLAGSDASVWAPVLDANRENVRAVFDRVVAVAVAIIEGDPNAFERAQRFWAEIERQ